MGILLWLSVLSVALEFNFESCFEGYICSSDLTSETIVLAVIRFQTPPLFNAEYEFKFDYSIK